MKPSQSVCAAYTRLVSRAGGIAVGTAVQMVLCTALDSLSVVRVVVGDAHCDFTLLQSSVGFSDANRP